MKSGIYKWTSPSGKYYIGQAVNLKRRYNDFLNFNRTYTSEGSAIDNARKKYNTSNSWNYEVIEYCEADKLNELEVKYIAEYDSHNSRIGYNSTLGGDGTKGLIGKHPTEETRKRMSEAHKGSKNPNYGKHHTEEARRRISEAHKGMKLSEEARKKKSKPIIQLTLDNKFIKEWDSITEAAHSLGCDSSLIMRVCQGKKKTAKGFHWKYKL